MAPERFRHPPTPGPIRVLIELALYALAAIAPFFVWHRAAWVAAVVIVLASLGFGTPRLIWLAKGAPGQ